MFSVLADVLWLVICELTRGREKTQDDFLSGFVLKDLCVFTRVSVLLD